MARQVRTNQNLSGQTLVAAADGSSRESFFSGCTFGSSPATRTKFTGDWRGTTFLNCTGSVDLSAALIYSCYWRGSVNLTGSLWPADIGSYKHEPLVAIMRDAAAALPTGIEKTVLNAGANYLAGITGPANYLSSWDDTAQSTWWSTATPAQKLNILARGRTIFAPYPNLLARWNKLASDLQAGVSVPFIMPLAIDVKWPALTHAVYGEMPAVSIHVDATYILALAEKSLYGLARKIEADAGPGHYCHAYSGFPPFVRVMGDPDDWFRQPWVNF